MSDGLIPPLNAPAGGLPAYGVQPGTQQQIVLARYVIVSGSGDGVFVYSGAPGLGNPPIAWMGSGLVDPYGNVLPSTTGVASSGTFQAGDTIINANGMFFYNGTPGPTTLAYSITSTNVLDPFGTTTGIGFCSYATGLQASLTAGNLNFGTSAGSTFITANSNGTLTAKMASGETGGISIVQSDHAVMSNGNVTGAHAISFTYPIDANDLAPGTHYMIELPFVATMEGQTLELGLSIDGSSSFTANTTISGTIVGAGGSINGTFRAHLKCATIGVSGTINAWTNGETGTVSTPATFANTGSLAGNMNTSIAFNTTVSHTIQVNAQWAALAAGQGVTAQGSECYRFGP